MHLPASCSLSKFILLSLLLLALCIHAAPASPFSPSSLESIHTSRPANNAILSYQRAPSLLNRGATPYHRVTIANGWHIHYKIFSVITPTSAALLDLRKFFSLALHELNERVLSGDEPVAISEVSLGKYTLQFMVERGFGMPLDWEVAKAFVEKMLEMTVPATFMAHIAPPGSDVGVAIKMWVGKMGGGK